MPARYAVVLLMALVLGACASVPKFDTAQVDKSITPSSAVAEISRVRGHRVFWGGTIVTSRNLKNSTELEVLGYPLDDAGRPQLDKTPLGRFLAVRSGYLEPVDYAPGRLVTIVGKLDEVREGKVGDAPYRYPIITAEQLALWPLSTSRSSDPQLHFGIGVGIIR
jgi:outer membrane lipoprotein